MKKITVTELKKQLKTKSKEELLKEIVELYKKFPDVKVFYQATMSSQGMKEVIETYKKKIRNEFFPTRGSGKARLSVVRKAVNDFKKISNSKTDIADLMVFYVENGVEYTDDYGDIDESFYSSMESMYEAALVHISKSGLEDEFFDRCQRIVSETSEIGWGFHDTLYGIFHTYFKRK